MYSYYATAVLYRMRLAGSGCRCGEARADNPIRALEILERVAEGRMDDAGAGLEEQVGLKPRQLRGAEFKLIFYTMNAEDVRFQEVAILKDA